MPAIASAQLLNYSTISRPLGTSYRVLSTEHFDVIFEDGYLNEAKDAVRVLNNHLDDSKHLLGHSRKLHMPIVLNGFNDLSNGFVTPLPFKQEIEITNLKGRSLSPRHASWMETVLPHELVHAVQANARRGFGFGALLRPFAPDFARTLNFMIPQGISEGLAVYHESRYEQGVGRLNHSFFKMRFRAAMASDKPWSMAQLVEAPSYTRPLDRFYLGGAHFVDYMAKRDSLAFFHRSASLNYRIPFLGYGIGLWYGARQWPAKVYRSFRSDVAEAEASFVNSLGSFSNHQVLFSEKGSLHRRPRWVNDNEIVVYAGGYGFRRGFYIYDVQSGKRRSLQTTSMTEDYVYSLSSDKQRLVYGRYTTDPLVAIKNVADLHELDLASAKGRQVTKGERVQAPVFGEEKAGFLALQNDGQFNQIVRVSENGSIENYAQFANLRFQEIAASPDGQQLAAVVGQQGRQGIFKIESKQGKVQLIPWIMHHNPIFDISWSQDGSFVLYSSEQNGISNIFAYDVDRGQSFQVTNVKYGALEPALSPDGKTLAYINYEHERFELVLLPFKPIESAMIENVADDFAVIPSLDEIAESGEGNVLPAGANLKKYNALRYLKPRTLFPVFETAPDNIFGDKSIGERFGAVIQGADPLQRLAYRVEGYTQASKFWGEATIQYGGFGIRPFASIYDQLSTINAGLRDENNELVSVVRVGRQRRGVSAGFEIPLLLERNIFQSGILLRLEGEFEEERFYTSDDIPFERQHTLEPAATLFYRLQSNPRDLIPNNGLLLNVSSNLDLQNDLGKNRAVISRLNAYLPFLRGANIGLRTYVRFLSQNSAGIYNLDTFLPRGYKDDFLLGGGNHTVAGFEYVQPIWFVDDGLFMIPFYLKAIYAFGFAEALLDGGGEYLSSNLEQKEAISTGLGLGVRFRLFYLFNFDIRFTAAYKHANDTWDFDLN